MAAVIARISGVVTYDDDSVEQFAAHLDDQGNIAVNSLSESQQSVGEVGQDTDWLTQMFDAIAATISLTTSGGGKTVSGMAAELSGRVALDDDTWGDFIVQYDGFVGAHVPDGGDENYWQTAIDTDLGGMTALFEGIVGEGNATITP